MVASSGSTIKEKDEAKLGLIMNEDPDMARLYREAYGDVKADKEHDYNEAVRIHDKYAYLKDGKTLENRKESEKYDLSKTEDKDIEDELLTTELSDMELDIIYKRYKLMQAENTDFLRDIEEEARDLMQNFSAGKAMTEDGERRVRSPREL